MASTEFEIQRIDALLNEQGIEVLRAFFNEKSNIAIGASAGTGKTVLLTNILSETILREVKAGNLSPFDELIAVTFTVEAARQMKEKVRKMLEEYNSKYPIQNFERLISDLELNSWISTIDSMTLHLAQIMAVDMQISPEIEIIDPFDYSLIEQEILNHIEDKYNEEVTFLQDVFKEHWKAVIRKGFELLSMYLLDTEKLNNRLESSFEDFYTHIENDSRIDTSQIASLREFNRKVLSCFRVVFSKFVALLDSEFRANSLYTHSSLQKAVADFLASPNSSKWREYFGARFKYLFIDEFQDTSYAQANVLSSLVESKTRIMIIGDPKQSIYTWRNAEPEIFATILNAAQKNKRDPFFQERFKYFDINRNFRSNPAIVELTNFFFCEKNPNSIFNNDKFTADFPLPNSDVEADAPSPEEPILPPHIHYFTTTACRNRGIGRLQLEAEYITSTISHISGNQSKIWLREHSETGTKWVIPKLGDCAILLQRRTKWWIIREQLIRNGIPYVMIADQGFYQRPEVTLLIDFLDWLGNPYETDALLRILRSPFVGVSDLFLRILVKNDFRLDQTQQKLEKLLERSSCKGSNLERDFVAVSKVINLKSNLRWSREGRKARLLEKILSTSHFREIIMAYSEGAQCVANLNLLCEIVDSWEEEELISYPELVTRLKFYRRADASIQNQAFLSELENKNAVKIATIHATKGLEFPIVFLYDVDISFKGQWRYSNSIFFGSPKYWFEGNQGQFLHLRQVEDPTSGQFRDLLREIYCSIPNGTSKFMQNMRKKYQGFIAEKWRLYYVALTRARDHIFHGYSYRGGQAPTWGNEFRKRILAFMEQRTPAYVEQLEDLPQYQPPKRPSFPLVFKPNSTISKLKTTFLPASLDPTHIYDLLLCPRRYQYITLKQARGMKCHEAGYSEFSSLFGNILHRMLEKYYYATDDTTVAIAYLNGIKYVSENERLLLEDAIKKYASFIKKHIASLRLQKPHILKEKSIQVQIRIKNRGIQLRGIIDLLILDGNDAYILDLKTNYPQVRSKDTRKTRLRKKFIKNHHLHQLLTYKMMIEKLGYGVKGLNIICINKTSEKTVQCNSIPANETSALLNSLKERMPLIVTENGLEKKDHAFCEVCEFRKLCTSQRDTHAHESKKLAASHT